MGGPSVAPAAGTMWPMLRFDDAIGLWRGGRAPAGAHRAHERRALERSPMSSSCELRRRLGGPFTATELAGLYSEQGTDWFSTWRFGWRRRSRRRGT